ncbi:hypothetical protein [Microbacterium gallinarum]|uniref:Uncharacterized protein n=1 Tax=Microbacterium gallinarum TaxID=2762209 RepID=A0ABR8X2F1_9MICO|nr:hypothetical protein [Microbacterium gallinarum]MBD8023463.1 hypothetical protein [Microbacterium gallinarum]
MPGNHQGNQVLTNEVIVGEVGELLGAPVRERVLVVVPPAVCAWADFPVRGVSGPLVAHASHHVTGAVDDDELRYTKRDDNARRQAAMAGLWDLCVGEDPQWLYETSAAYSVWSYDHGLWFTTGEGDWDETILERLIDTDSTIPRLPAGINLDRLVEVADVINQLSPEQLLTVMSAVPVEWGTDDRDLEAMAWFLYSRRRPVAERLRKRAEPTSGDRRTGTPT